jgi:hypothetical protein
MTKSYFSVALYADIEVQMTVLLIISISFQKSFFRVADDKHPCRMLLCNSRMKIRPSENEYTQLGCKKRDSDTKAFQTHKTSNF